MNSLIIDAAKDKIFLQIIVNNKHYTNEYFNNSENFDILSSIIFNFLKKNGVNLDNISHILVTQGPGKFSSIRASIVVAKAKSI